MATFVIIFIAGLLTGIVIGFLHFAPKKVGNLVITKDNGKDIYYMAINEEARVKIPTLESISLRVIIVD